MKLPSPKNIVPYLALAEARLVWVLFVVSLGVLAAIFFFLPPALFLAVAALTLGIVAAMFFLIARIVRMRTASAYEHMTLESIVASIPDGVLAYDEDFVLRSMNHAAEEVFGVVRQEIVGKRITPELARSPHFRLLAQIMFPSLAASMRPVSEDEKRQVVDVVTSAPERRVRVTTIKLTNKGLLRGFVKLVQDTSREAEISSAKNEFIAVAAHNLRTPLNGLKWMLETISRESALSEDGKRMIENGLRASDRMIGIINEFLLISQMEEGRYGYSFSPLVLNTFMESLLSEFSVSVERAGIRMQYAKPDAPITINGDVEKLSIAISNLIDNAVLYNVENGEVSISVRRVPAGGTGKDVAEIRIHDTGIGISSEQIPRLFTKFFRTENGVRARPDGTGLGLYIAKNIIEKHKGEIRIESELNRGATAIVTLPILEVEPASQAGGPVRLQ